MRPCGAMTLAMPALICPTETERHHLAKTLAGLEEHSKSVVSYNGVDLKNLSSNQIGLQRGILFGRRFTLFEGTIVENITMGRPGIKSKDILWALTVTELDKDLQSMALGLETLVLDGGNTLNSSQRLRVLLARAIVTRPSLLILDGALHEIPEKIREPILKRLNSNECSWTLIIVTTDRNIKKNVQKCLSLNYLP
jgi:putative ABC transport system ATP-binding protein